MPTKAVLLDIEGTVCSISFVHDVLFPYALTALPSYLSEHWNSPDFQPYRNAFPAEVRDDKVKLEAYVRELTELDKKEPCLKQLQGLLWRTGYTTGAIKAPIYEDVLPALQRWRAEGKKVVIYSSGSIAAQRLLFTHTTSGDLTPHLSAYHDPVTSGPKTLSSSYTHIAAAEGVVPEEWVFYSDNVREVEAATEAGMRAVVVVRPGNRELSEEERGRWGVVGGFDGL
ncbi:2,3-diketo-5-methylthio-1-phosphopentane phosphatase [Ascodesmis nigricans]|uniref:Enolase-phosphatase E1 n=1 Tax=Ascodesmis nigricans TaxID=341454 RepID=A0A4V3SHW5_9PEZI|nr:2,3-diketo-5-methylthio-1-phosphopentane phosphatase [Ascodesmis nigricans]